MRERARRGGGGEGGLLRRGNFFFHSIQNIGEVGQKKIHSITFGPAISLVLNPFPLEWGSCHRWTYGDETEGGRDGGRGRDALIKLMEEGSNSNVFFFFSFSLL